MKSLGDAPEICWEAASVGNKEGLPNPGGPSCLGRETP